MIIDFLVINRNLSHKQTYFLYKLKQACKYASVENRISFDYFLAKSLFLPNER